MFLNQHISKPESKVKFKIELKNESIAATCTVSLNLKKVIEVIARRIISSAVFFEPQCII